MRCWSSSSHPGWTRGLTAETAATALRRVRPRDTLARTLRTIAVDRVAELRRPDRRIADASQTLSHAVTASGTTLMALLGIGEVVAKILTRTGPHNPVPVPGNLYLVLRRGPIEVSSGDVMCHRGRATKRPCAA